MTGTSNSLRSLLETQSGSGWGGGLGRKRGEQVPRVQARTLRRSALRLGVAAPRRRPAARRPDAPRRRPDAPRRRPDARRPDAPRRCPDARHPAAPTPRADAPPPRADAPTPDAPPPRADAPTPRRPAPSPGPPTPRARPLVGAVVQGTHSTRFLVFDSKTADVLSHHQVELTPEFPKEGWVEHDPKEILRSVCECIERTCQKLAELNVDVSSVKAIGVSNQRETTVIWDKLTGEPLYNAVAWLDLRTQPTVENLSKKIPGNNNFVKSKTGLPLSTYFSAVKLRWLLDNVRPVQEAVEGGRALFGTVDSWLIWSLTGGANGGVHCTDVTNASRTMLFNIHSLEWDKELCDFFEIPMDILPRVWSSSEIYGLVKAGALQGVPISGCLGDQSAALVGQMCFQEGQAKNTYGTGCFLLYNTGRKCVFSEHGLLTTVAYKLGRDKPVCYALEGSVAVAGAVIRWLRDNLGIIETSEEIEVLAKDVGTSYGCYFVPAFSGLCAPYWEPSARGIICGLTQFTGKRHIAFAALESVCFQTREILDAMNRDGGVPLRHLQVDGRMTRNKILMQLQADILHVPVVKPAMAETAALGAAMAAGAAEGVGVWSLEPEDRWVIATERFEPQVQAAESEARYATWKKAVRKSVGWTTAESERPDPALFSSLPLGFFIVGSVIMLIGARYISGTPH